MINLVILYYFYAKQIEDVAEWEEIAATAMAVQNLDFVDDSKIGGYWST